jgi:hypothetical protein
VTGVSLEKAAFLSANNDKNLPSLKRLLLQTLSSESITSP